MRQGGRKCREHHPKASNSKEIIKTRKEKNKMKKSKIEKKQWNKSCFFEKIKINKLSAKLTEKNRRPKSLKQK